MVVPTNAPVAIEGGPAGGSQPLAMTWRTFGRITTWAPSGRDACKRLGEGVACAGSDAKS